MTFSLVVPVLDAQDLLSRLLGRVGSLADVANGMGWSLVEVVVVDDGSCPAMLLPDGVALPCVVRAIRNGRNMGKGYSVRRGALEAKGDFVLMSDVDESAPLEEFAKLASAWKPGVAMVCGSRVKDDDRPFLRRVLSRIFRLIVRSSVHDTQCGFKLFDMSKMRQVFESQKIDGFAFDVELIRKAEALGDGTVVEVPVAWHGGSRSSLRVMRDAPKMLFDLARIPASRRARRRRGDLQTTST